MASDAKGGAIGVNLAPHAGANPMGAAPVTIGHTWVIIAGALALLWLLGGVAFRTIRM